MGRRTWTPPPNWPAPPTPGWRRHWVHLVAVGVLGLGVGATIGDDGTTTPPPSRAVGSTAVTDTSPTPAPSAGAPGAESGTVARLREALAARDAARARARRAEAAAAVAAGSSSGSSSRSSAPTTTTPTVSCTHTSSGSCIQGGQFCPTADEGSYGYDANGRRYLCEGRHWRVP